MSLVNIDSLQRQVLLMLKKINPPAGIELLSYKRNRSVILIMEPENRVTVKERGYLDQEFTVAGKEVPRILKTLIKREFPRSRKVRIHKFSDQLELSIPRKKL